MQGRATYEPHERTHKRYFAHFKMAFIRHAHVLPDILINGYVDCFRCLSFSVIRSPFSLASSQFQIHGYHFRLSHCWLLANIDAIMQTERKNVEGEERREREDDREECNTTRGEKNSFFLMLLARNGESLCGNCKYNFGVRESERKHSEIHQLHCAFVWSVNRWRMKETSLSEVSFSHTSHCYVWMSRRIKLQFFNCIASHHDPIALPNTKDLANVCGDNFKV